MGNLENRLSRLEGRIRPSPQRSPAEELERETRVAELKQLCRSARQKAEREAEEGFPQRLLALLELEERVRNRLAGS